MNKRLSYVTEWRLDAPIEQVWDALEVETTEVRPPARLALHERLHRHELLRAATMARAFSQG